MTTHQIILQVVIYTKKYHVFAPMGRFQLELIYLYFPPSSHLVLLVLILTKIYSALWRQLGSYLIEK